MAETAIYFAPLEGITGHIFRSVHHELFGSCIDRYFSPFIVATYTKSYKTREKEDARPENNVGIPMIPQILANDAGEFLHAAGWLHEMGYREINLNLGCPVGTVVSKNRGSGFLRVPDELEKFLHEVFSQLPEDMKLSLKTRIGFEDPKESENLFSIYGSFPLSELIIHPRTRKEMYGGRPHLEVFDQAAYLSEKFPVCYNGDVNTAEEYREICRKFAWISAVMIGRGLISNPGLAGEIRTGDPVTKQALREFHDRLYLAYAREYEGNGGGERILVSRMKEIWNFMGSSFEDSERYLKGIRKAGSRVQYEAAVRMLMSNCDIKVTSWE